MSLDKILKYTHFYLIKKLNFFVVASAIRTRHAECTSCKFSARISKLVVQTVWWAWPRGTNIA